MNLSRFVAAMSMMVLAAGAGNGQNYPTKPVRIVTGLPAGGSDSIGRLVAQGLTVSLGQQVIVENRAGGVIPGEIVSRAPPDGHTLIIMSASLWLAPFMRDRTPYDPVKDFSPITLTTNAPNILVVNPGLPVKSVKDLIALAKAKPGELNYASSGLGSSSHLAAELFKSMTGVNIVRIPYKGNVPALNDLMGGLVQLSFASAVSVAPHAKSGRLRALAVTSPKPSPLYPDLPTVAASGLPGYEAGTITGMLAPARTPAAIITRLNQETVRILNRADVKEKLAVVGIDVVASSPAELAATIKSEMARLGKVIKDAGIRDE